MRTLGALLAVTLLVPACGGGEKASAPLPTAGGASLELTSPAFSDGGRIPRRYTCDGDGISPPLSWSGVSREARELALVVEDPDAGRFLHWTVLAIAATQTGFPEDTVSPGAVETDNSFGDPGWGAPCPPKGDAPHRYVFALYAARTPLGLDEQASPDEVRARLARVALARGTLTGRYGRN